MAKTTSLSTKVAASVLYIINFIIMVICVFMLAFGLWIITSPSSLYSVINASGNATLKALVQDMLTLRVGIAITAVATFIFFVCFMGFYGAISKSSFLLFMYAAIVLLLLLLECALLYYFSSNLVEKGFQDDGQWTHALRIIFKCCEYNTSLPEEIKPPWSCCGPEWYPNNCTAIFTYKKVKQINIPNLFQGAAANFQANIAIVVLVTPFVYKTYVRPVCLNFDTNFEKHQLVPNRLGKVAGWGLTEANGPGPSSVLKVVEMPYITIDICVNSFPLSFREYVTGDNICAGYTNGTALCRGDSGGGLVFPDLELGVPRYYLRGVVSTAPSDENSCNVNTYTLFTKITKYEDLIKQYL